ncbi:unnamed protein product [Parnassius apollo]|uniref:(apollo) hypothetical protein n=1 Tax=Parnassius apollo TaxID=110799 RepID=A0A8S3X5Z5_PARAO|nr:unnamed protein product [Parnassius apollo]
MINYLLIQDKPAEHHSQQESDSQSTENNLSQSTEKNLSELPRPNKRPRINQKDEMVSEALSIMKNISERQNASKILEKDEDGLFGDYIAAQLRKMERSTKAIVRHRINNIIFEAETGIRADMFSDFSRPSSTHSHPGYYSASRPSSTHSHPGYYSAAPTNYSTSVYSAQSHETVSPPKTFEEDISPLTRNSTQHIEDILTSLNP